MRGIAVIELSGTAKDAVTAIQVYQVRYIATEELALKSTGNEELALKSTDNGRNSLGKHKNSSKRFTNEYYSN